LNPAGRPYENTNGFGVYCVIVRMIGIIGIGGIIAVVGGKG